MANTARRRMDVPRLSNFRVAAAVEYVDGEGERRWKTGFNSEPCSVGGSICAERSALSDLENAANILAVYIVSDSIKPITPGMLCREYMSTRFGAGVVKPEEFRVVLAGCKGNEVLWPTIIDTTLAKLYPCVTPLSRPANLPICMPCEPNDGDLAKAAVAEARKSDDLSIFPSQAYYGVSYAAALR